jgi:(2Fe-2S) ferredoxin
LAIHQRMEHVRQKGHCWRKIRVGIWYKHTEFEDARSIVPLVDKDNPIEDYQKLRLEYKKKDRDVDLTIQTI